MEAVVKSVGGGYCRLQMPLSLALAIRGTVAGHRLSALEGEGDNPPPPPSDASPPPPNPTPAPSLPPSLPPPPQTPPKMWGMWDSCAACTHVCRAFRRPGAYVEYGLLLQLVTPLQPLLEVLPVLVR